jgi:hypothetical protein
MQTHYLLRGALLFNVALLALPACNIHSISASTTGAGAGGSGGAAATTGSSMADGGATAATTTAGAGGAETTSSSSSAAATSSSGSGGSAGVPCAAAASHVYAITTDKKLYSLDYVPQMPWATTLVGALACPTAADPHSIAIDRSGQAWVVYTDGKLYKVDTATAACTATAFVAGQHGFTTFSMAFAADAPGGDTETLYVSGSGASGSPTGLASIDRSTLVLTPIGDYDMPAMTAPVTPPVFLAGGGDAKLGGGFLINDSYYIGHFDPTSAHVIKTLNESSLLIHGLPATAHYAMIPWGDRYRIFTTDPGGMLDYLDYNDEITIVQASSATGVTAISLLTLSASTCATANPLP